MMEDNRTRMTPRQALLLVMNHVDYTILKCSPTEPVAAALPADVIAMARRTLDAEPEA